MSIGLPSHKSWPNLIFARFPHCNYSVKPQKQGKKEGPSSNCKFVPNCSTIKNPTGSSHAYSIQPKWLTLLWGNTSRIDKSPSNLRINVDRCESWILRARQLGQHIRTDCQPTSFLYFLSDPSPFIASPCQSVTQSVMFLPNEYVHIASIFWPKIPLSIKAQRSLSEIQNRSIIWMSVFKVLALLWLF